ncbi:MAG: hypothetical protein GYB33_02980 [Gammaproteobacteria bacterium]|nr:hypothetical protein [Gammaproteobacteria bacterium]
MIIGVYTPSLTTILRLTFNPQRPSQLLPLARKFYEGDRKRRKVLENKGVENLKTRISAVTERYQTSIDFLPVRRRKVEANFFGGDISSNGGAMLLRQVDRRLDPCHSVAQALGDNRRQAGCEFSLEELTAVRGHQFGAR